MTTAAQKMDQAKAAILKNADVASQIGAIYKFILEGDGGGIWIVTLKGNPDIQEGDGPAECVIKMAAQDYVDMLEGRADGQQLFFSGKLQIEGDLALAMKLQHVSELMSA